MPKEMKADRGFTIFHDLVIDSTKEKIFNAISEPEHLVNWWPLKCTGKPEVGEEYNLYFGEPYNWYGSVIAADFPDTFHIKMTLSDPDWDPTSFGFDLESNKDGILVHFWHKNWPACNAHFKTASYCWAILLSGLKNYVEKGEIIPFEKRN